MKIAALAGSTSEDFVRKVLPKAALTTTPDYDQAVALLLKDEVNVLVADREAIALTAFLHPKENLVEVNYQLLIQDRKTGTVEEVREKTRVWQREASP